jgi:hypothetical protein
MAYEMKDNTGSLFANENRQSDSHANAKGTALIDGKEYWVDAWTNTSAGGKRYQSLKFKLKDKQPSAQGGGFGGGGASVNQDLDDDIPF